MQKYEMKPYQTYKIKIIQILEYFNWLVVGWFEDLHRFSDHSAISRHGSRR